MSSTSAREALQASRSMPQYLAQLRSLLRRPMDAHEVLPLEETKAIRASAANVERMPFWKVEIRFEQKGDSRFKQFINRLCELDNAGIFLWPPMANVCGLLRPVSLADVNFDFEYELIPDGIIAILSSDLQNKMLLDFSEDAGGQRVLEIEVSGKCWGNVAY